MDARRAISLARPFAHRLSRRSAVISMPTAALAFGSRAAAQDSADGQQVGVAPPGQSSFEFVGRVDQTGMDLGFSGYLTRLAGLDHSALFSGSDPLARSEADARILITGSAAGVSRSILNGVFVVNAEGTLRFLLADEPGASLASPESFAVGQEICALAIRVQSVITVYAPQMGLSTGYCDAVVDATTPFELDGQSYAFGEAGSSYRLSFNGLGQLIDPENLVSAISIAGNGITAG